uniref:Uncharacterized protein n=1 Tax=Oryza brachyantha TaxID=4533 RepID=J3LC37_ORYBR
MQDPEPELFDLRPQGVGGARVGGGCGMGGGGEERGDGEQRHHRGGSGGGEAEPAGGLGVCAAVSKYERESKGSGIPTLLIYPTRLSLDHMLHKVWKRKTRLEPSNLQLQLAKTAPHHRHSRRRTEPYFNLGNNLLTETLALALALVGEKLSKAEYKPPYSTSNTQERGNNE